MVHPLLNLCLLAAITLSASLTASAAPPLGWVEAEGSAAVGPGGVELARREAEQDLRRNAALRVSGEVWGDSASEVSVNGEPATLRSSTTVRPGAVMGEVEVLDASVQDGLLRLEGRAEWLGDGAACAAPHPWKKRVAVVGARVDVPGETADLPDLPQALAGLVATLLQHQGEDRVLNLSTFRLQESARQDDLAGNQRAAALQQLWRQQGISHLVVPRVRAFGMRGQDHALREGWIPTLNLADRGERDLAIELELYELPDGVRVGHSRAFGQARGKVWFPHNPSAASPEVLDSAVGETLRQVLGQATDELLATLRCRPFATRIVEVRDARSLFIDAGSEAGLEPGDQLVIYARAAPFDLPGDPAAVPQYPQQAVGTARIDQVSGRFAHARVEGNLPSGTVRTKARIARSSPLATGPGWAAPAAGRRTGGSFGPRMGQRGSLTLSQRVREAECGHVPRSALLQKPRDGLIAVQAMIAASTWRCCQPDREDARPDRPH